VKASCRDLEEALRGDDAALREAVEEHARTCASCATELSEWAAISAAAPSMRKAWGSPELWPQIRQALAEESQRAPSAAFAPPGSALTWIPAAAIIALFAIASRSVLRADVAVEVSGS